MKKWEYWSGILVADDKFINEYDAYFPGSNLLEPENHTSFPQMTLMGNLGWELIHVEPHTAYRFKQVEVPNAYFCVFKRRKV
jgi:hypothetical protein